MPPRKPRAAHVSPRRWPFREVLLVRHGETEWNVQGRRQGQLDSPLTERGCRQAVALARLIDAQAAADAAAAADGVYSSPLGRSVATAEVIADARGFPVRLISSLAEIDHGEFAGLTSDEIEDRWPGALADRERSKYSWRFPGGESYDDASVRAAAAIEEIAASGLRRPIVVAHAMIGRVVIGHLLNLTPAAALVWEVKHGAILRIDPNARRAEVISSGI